MSNVMEMWCKTHNVQYWLMSYGRSSLEDGGFSPQFFSDHTYPCELRIITENTFEIHFSDDELTPQGHADSRLFHRARVVQVKECPEPECQAMKYGGKRYCKTCWGHGVYDPATKEEKAAWAKKHRRCEHCYRAIVDDRCDCHNWMFSHPEMKCDVCHEFLDGPPIKPRPYGIRCSTPEVHATPSPK